MRRTAMLFAVAALVGCTTPDTAPPEEEIGEAKLAAESLAAPSRPNVIRFLEQSTFGPKLANITAVQGIGISQAITNEMAVPAGLYDAPAHPDSATTYRDIAVSLFEDAISDQDQLRQRVAIALHQILAVSVSTVGSQPAMAVYFNLLRAGAFGNYRDILYKITLSAAMGKFLNMSNNVAFDSAGNNIAPDENYARELMQLFSIGLSKLNDDGTPKLDCPDGTGKYDGVPDVSCTVPAGGRPIPAYTEDDVENYAHALTGWTYSAASCPSKGGKNNTFSTNPMMPCDVNHYHNNPVNASLPLLNGYSTVTAIPAGSTKKLAELNLDKVIDSVFNDPSTPPYICKQLIQSLVTSNPTPTYVKDVVAKFKNNGAGVRGDLGAVVRAILEHNEARGAVPQFALQSKYGHVRPPMLFITSVIRWFNGTAAAVPYTKLNADGTTTYGWSGGGGTLNTWSANMAQSMGRPPSVFSYYSPTNQIAEPLPDGTRLLAPELGIVSTATLHERVNFLSTIFFANMATNMPNITIDLTVVPEDVGPMVDWINLNIMHDTMSTAAKSIISDAASDAAVPAANRKKLALYLALSSADYQTEK